MSNKLQIALDALKALGRVLQAGTPSIDTIHELGADCPMEEAWLIFHDEVRPCMAALEAMQGQSDDSEIINHEEALSLAYIKRQESNLARCYIDLAAPVPAKQERTPDQIKSEIADLLWELNRIDVVVKSL